ncbi:putative glucosylceramidase 3 isoform X2 [Corticium candelabrum]|uniref:putative glucosylceramidase 3 isoform X2 n=1 Tax=Corticium candelabrum TaxID=121492 RepID=UPI002E26F373|nr:putative glucosylceramidase 3 isoform X2 [Corticium candelabrum]XP_062521312.1 putative glucosylceramidase 3 isoform X2 [Corticium candelabrum]
MNFGRSFRFQEMLGFGGAFTESSSFVWSGLNSESRQQILDLFFSKDGLQYSLARVPIGSCDFSLSFYSYDDVEGDTDLEHFSIEHDQKWRIPFMKAAIATRAKWSNTSIKFLGSPWSAPGWMKSDGLMSCPVSCLLCTLKAKYQDTYSKYISLFVSKFTEIGIPIWGVTVQNEPGACSPLYEGMHFTPETERDFVKNHLGPVLSSDHPHLALLVYDHNKDHVAKWAETIYSDKNASQYVWGMAVHWYSGDQFSNLNTTHYIDVSKPILATEATVKREKDPTDPLWSHGEHYAHDMIGDFNNWVVGFIDWNLLLDMYGGPDHAGPHECEGLIKCGSDAMILADNTTGKIYLQTFYYYMGHFSKFVPPGSIRIGVVSSNEDLEATGFVTPDNTTAVVVMNSHDDPITYKLLDEISTLAVNVTIPAHAIQTVLYSV